MTIRNLRIANGYAADQGGAIRNSWRGNLNVYNSTFSNNSSGTDGPGGGAIFIHTGTLVVEDSTFEDNVSRGHAGGGAINVLLANAIISNTRFVNNHTAGAGSGGAFYNDGTLDTNGYIGFFDNQWHNNSGIGEGGAAFTYLYPEQTSSFVEIRRNVFKNNEIKMRPSDNISIGGGLRHGNGPLRLSHSSFIDNTAYRQGGAIWIGEASPATITNITVSGNSANNPNEENQGLGGGIMPGNGNVTITHSTIVNNDAGFMGGGGMFGGGHGVVLKNTIIAHNIVGNIWSININCAHTYTDGSSNIQNTQRKPNDSNDHDCTPNMIIADPLLMDLRVNDVLPGHPLSASSPALNSAASCGAADDQTGTIRPQGGRCDIGAIEMQVDPVPPRRYPANKSVISTNPDWPAFTFEHVDGIEWYGMWIGSADYSNQALYNWYPATDAIGAPSGLAGICERTICTLPVDMWLTNGDYAWWMTYYGDTLTEHGSYWNVSTFSVYLPAPRVGALNNVTPSGTVNTAPAEITWERDPNVLWMEIWLGQVVGPHGTPDTAFYGWVDATTICDATACTLDLADVSVPDGDYEMWMRLWGPGGFLQWTDVNGGQPTMTFTVNTDN